MALSDIELGKSRIMAEARSALRRIGIEYQTIMFELPNTPDADGATLCVSAEGKTVTNWFRREELEDSRDHVARADIRHKIAGMVGEIKQSDAA